MPGGPLRSRKSNSLGNINTIIPPPTTKYVTNSDKNVETVKLYSFPWRRRSTIGNIKPRWAFRRFR